MNKTLQIVNKHFFAISFPLCFIYFLFLLFIRFQYDVPYSDELLVLYVVPVVYAANQYLTRVYLVVTIYVIILSHALIFLTTPNWLEGSVIIIIVFSLFIFTSEMLYRSNRNVSETAKNLQITLQSIGDAVIAINRKGYVDYINPVGSRLTGWSSEEALGKKLQDVFHIINSKTRQRCEDPVEKVIKSGEISGLENETILISKDGTEFQIADSAAPIFNNEGYCIGVVLTFRDVTNEYQSQKELKKSKELMEIFVENTPAAVAMLDCDLCYIAYSKRWLIDYQLKDQNLVGKHHYDVFPEIKNMAEWQEIHKRCLNGEVVISDEDRFIREDGTVDWIRYEVRPWRQSNGNIGGILLLTEVITDRKKIEFALKKSEEMYHQAIEVADAVPYYQNYETNQYEFVGEGILQLTGYTPNEFTPDVWQSIEEELVLLKDLKDLNIPDAVKKAKSNEGISWRADYKITTKNGGLKWLSNAAIQVRDDYGNVIGSLGILQDITDRKQIEVALEKNRQMYRQAIEASGAVPYYLNYKTDNYDFLGNNIDVLTGYRPEEFTPEIWDKLTLEEIQQNPKLKNLNVKDSIKKSKTESGMDWKCDYKIKTRTGVERWISNTAIQVLDDSGNVIGSLGTLQDITDRKIAEEALKVSETRFRRYFELGLVGMAITTPEKGWIEFNDTLCEMFGYTRDEFKNKNWEEMTHPNDVEYNLNYFKKVLAGEIDDYIIEKRFIHKDGSSVYTMVSVKAQRKQDGSVENFLVLVHNITENKLAAEELRQSETKLKNIIDSTQAVFWQLDLQSQRFTYMSEQIEDLLGYPVNSWSDMQDWINRIHPEDRKNSVDFCISQTNEGANHEFEYRMISKDQKEVWIRDTVTILKEDQKPVALIGFFFDVTKQKLVETELQNIDKLNSIGTLAGGIAHDFNNVLTGVFGNLSIAKDELVSTHPSHEYIQDAIQSLNRAKRLTKQLLTFAKGGDPVKEPVNLKELVEEIVRFDLSGSNVKPVFYMADEICIAEIDKGQLQQVVSNLTINANQAMTEGGLLHISIKRYSNHSRQLPYLNDLDYIQIMFQDNGTGIDPNVIDRIFEPFFSTKHTGYGLGLATVFSIVNKHDGYVHVESELGKGSVFTIYIPALTESVEHISQDIQENPDWEKQSANILVMDDEEVIRNLLSSSLSRFGFNVQVKSDGRQAVDAYQSALSNDHPFDIVILDITVPGGMGGEEAIKEILKINPEAKCIVSSGYANDPVMANYKDYGFKAVAPKPYTLTEMKDIINQVLNG